MFSTTTTIAAASIMQIHARKKQLIKRRFAFPI
jgi:hypothetical protein